MVGVWWKGRKIYFIANNAVTYETHEVTECHMFYAG
jgi:hypothetical protein